MTTVSCRHPVRISAECPPVALCHILTTTRRFRRRRGCLARLSRVLAPAMATSLMRNSHHRSTYRHSRCHRRSPVLRRRMNDPDAVRPPGAIGAAPQGAAPSGSVMTLPPEDQPETGKPKELPASLKKQLVDFGTKEPAGTIVIDTPNTYLYLVLGNGKALRYGIGVGREGFTWAGTERVSRMKEWPDWFPPSEMIDRQPYLPRMMAGGPGNPLGARALYLGHTLYRIHGTNQPSTIGSFVSSGCIRLLNEDIEDLFSRVQVGTRVVVMPGKAPEHIANTGPQPVANSPMSIGAPPANVAPGSGAPPNAGAAPRNNAAAITSSPLPPVR